MSAHPQVPLSNGFVDAIGNTPLIHLRRASEETGRQKEEKGRRHRRDEGRAAAEEEEEARVVRGRAARGGSQTFTESRGPGSIE